MKKKLISIITAIAVATVLLPVALGVGAMEVYGILSGSSFSSYITFYNVKNTTASITVQKLVENADENHPADPDTEFEFELKINGEAAENLNYTLKDKDGKTISENETTDASGKFKLKNGQQASFKELDIGAECTVTETELEPFIQTDPVDSEGVACPYTTTLTAKAEKVVFKNLYRPEGGAVLSVKKVDKNGEMLSGATLQLIQKGEDGSEDIIAEWVSDKTSKALQVPAGSYILRELKAPTGYEVADDVVFELKDMEGVQEVVMVDKLANIVPTGVAFFQKPLVRILAMLIVLLGAFVAVYFGVIRRKKQS